MTEISVAAAGPSVEPKTVAVDDLRPPGERYFRHPGDVVRVVLWALATIVLALLIGIATATSDGLTADLSRAAGRLPDSVRELEFSVVQGLVTLLPFVIAVTLAWQRRWRRLGVFVAASLAGAAVYLGLDALLDLPGRLPDADVDRGWVATSAFPPPAYLAGATAAATACKPWLSRPWRRACDLALAALALTLAVAGTAGVPVLLLAVAAGATVGAALLVALGAPNRRPSPSSVIEALRGAGLDVVSVSVERAEGGRSQLYRGDLGDGRGVFVKVYARDSRDADLLYRSYRALLLRGPTDEWPSGSLESDVDRQALLLVLAARAGIECPAMLTVAALADGSVALAMERRDGSTLDRIDAAEVDAPLLEAVWREAAALHAARIAHRSLRPANILVDDGRPVVLDLGKARGSASDRLQAIDRAELLASLAPLVGVEVAVSSAAGVLDPGDLAQAMPYLQPLALSRATRSRASKSELKALREGVADATGEEVPPLERLQRVRGKTLLMIAALTAAFYVLLPQLADVGDSVAALRDANWGWLAVCIVMSGATYVFSAVGLAGGVTGHLPLVPSVFASVASSFVNRVTPANVGGMALNVRYMQKAGVDPPEAVTGMGLNVLAGGIVHLVLLVAFFAWAGQGGGGFQIPSSSRMLTIIAVVLAVIGLVMATRKGRRLVRAHVLGFLQRSWASLVSLSKSPAKLAALFGGSLGVTLAYICALAAAVTAFDTGVSFADVGAVYLGSSLIAAAAPTPGGLGAMEAALVAGFTGVGVEPGIAVAAVLSYRLATYWLPILPGWISFHVLEHRNLI